MVAKIDNGSAGGSNVARWYPPAKRDAHRRARRALRLHLRGHEVRPFTITTRQGGTLRSL